MNNIATKQTEFFVLLQDIGLNTLFEKTLGKLGSDCDVIKSAYDINSLASNYKLQNPAITILGSAYFTLNPEDDDHKKDIITKRFIFGWYKTILEKDIKNNPGAYQGKSIITPIIAVYREGDNVQIPENLKTLVLPKEQLDINKLEGILRTDLKKHIYEMGIDINSFRRISLPEEKAYVPQEPVVQNPVSPDPPKEFSAEYKTEDNTIYIEGKIDENSSKNLALIYQQNQKTIALAGNELKINVEEANFDDITESTNLANFLSALERTNKVKKVKFQGLDKKNLGNSESIYKLNFADSFSS